MGYPKLSLALLLTSKALSQSSPVEEADAKNTNSSAVTQAQVRVSLMIAPCLVNNRRRSAPAHAFDAHSMPWPEHCLYAES
eukprot:6190086-Pleurochrysis_carterae.AAC.2